MDKLKRHSEILDKMNDLYERKNNDYGNSVHDTYLKFGPSAYLVRMYDKLNRIHTLTSTPDSCKVQDEKVLDSLIDLGNYAILMYMELEEEQNRVYGVNEDGK